MIHQSECWSLFIQSWSPLFVLCALQYLCIVFEMYMYIGIFVLWILLYIPGGWVICLFNSHLRTFFLILEREEQVREGEGEEYWWRGETLIASFLHTPQPRDRTCSLDKCPDQELNPRPYTLLEDAPTTWVTQAVAGGLFFEGPVHASLSFLFSSCLLECLLSICYQTLSLLFLHGGVFGNPCSQSDV